MSETQMVTASAQLADWVGMEKGQLIKTIKAQCFKGVRNQDDITDTQLGVYIQLANTLKLNPMLPGMMYAYPDKGGGIVPMIGPDGIFKLLMEHPEVVSWDSQSEKDEHGELIATATIYLKDTEHPIVKKCYLSEWKVASNPNWNQRPRHMLELRALKLAARQVVHGMPFDEDEKIMMHEQGGMVNITPGAAEEPEEKPVQKRPTPPAPAKGVAGAKAAAAKAAEKQAAEDKPEPEPEPENVVEGEVVEDQPEDGTTPEPATEESEDVEVVEDEAAPLEALEAGQKVSGKIVVESTRDLSINKKPAKQVVSSGGLYKGTFYTFNVDKEWSGSVDVELEGKSAKTKDGQKVLVFEV